LQPRVWGAFREKQAPRATPSSANRRRFNSAHQKKPHRSGAEVGHEEAAVSRCQGPATSSGTGPASRRASSGDRPFRTPKTTHASQLIASGLDVITVSRRLGHSNPTVTLGVYVHLFGNTEDRAATVIEAAMAGVLGD
jgi:integrase